MIVYIPLLFTNYLKLMTLSFALVVLLVSQGQTTTMLYMDKYQLAEESELVVSGQVQKRSSFYDNSHNMIYTQVDIKVRQSIKGSTSNSSISIINAGGTVGDTQIKVFGEAEFELNEKVLVFLKKTNVMSEISNGSFFEIPGRTQGKFDIFEDENGQEMIYNTYPNIELVTPGNNGTFTKVTPNTESVVLSKFIEDIQ